MGLLVECWSLLLRANTALLPWLGSCSSPSACTCDHSRANLIRTSSSTSASLRRSLSRSARLVPLVARPLPGRTQTGQRDLAAIAYSRDGGRNGSAREGIDASNALRSLYSRTFVSRSFLTSQSSEHVDDSCQTLRRRTIPFCSAVLRPRTPPPQLGTVLPAMERELQWATSARASRYGVAGRRAVDDDREEATRVERAERQAVGLERPGEHKRSLPCGLGLTPSRAN